MPVYLYEVVREDKQPGERFEVVQRMAEDPLTAHPETGEPVRRVITAPAIGSRWMGMNMERSVKDDKKLNDLGFTKYEKSGDGKYVKKFGQGPNLISKD
ncbi:FmdB family zinc ribbon protein [Rubinisphaera italica]|uniref:Zinc ribbon domain protein n=1 Tax=Rubinisphaera italica TaxID=2527969 RepID=A0A5C5XK07_9PLAN|nr:FmdB family transcriptional regulator [Rubinisphaera italica]TWT62465.1 Zinc ribbon domain protein [Rubinisphaera italica]HBN75637.1 FmdB family transcriptional regulator [Planctomycetaceae bacterium]|tara:strand:+ start:275 stop:571 length:297 start_codon:yes stop_codon:yes gene_type:complete